MNNQHTAADTLPLDDQHSERNLLARIFLSNVLSNGKMFEFFQNRSISGRIKFSILTVDLAFDIADAFIERSKK